MKTIGLHEVWSFFDQSPKVRNASNKEIRKGIGHPVKSYFELAQKVAELQFQNRDYVLFFRGQNADYRDTCDYTTLKPSLFRPTPGEPINPPGSELRRRYELLRLAEDNLLERYREFKLPEVERLARYQVLRWSILQHYEACLTPLLDVTHSLRIAASFASLGATEKAFLFVLGAPNLSGAITASAEAGIQIVRLASVCPPSAVRPHIQEGYLLGEYPEMSSYPQKKLYEHYEIDFGRRLVAKFSFEPETFWNMPAFPRVAREALYPPEKDDGIYRLAMKVKKTIEFAPQVNKPNHHTKSMVQQQTTIAPQS